MSIASATNDAPFKLDLDAYLARIGYVGSREPTRATLDALSFAHVSTIPFENLDVLLGRGISLAPADIERKLVHERRGGYCFEQNGLFLMVLEALGFRVEPLGARVRWQRARSFTPPRTHLFAKVDLADGESDKIHDYWIADVGVGGMSLTSAIRLDVDGEQATRHEPRRIHREPDPRARDGVRMFHQVRLDADPDAWLDVAEITLDEVHPIDRELANWWTSTHPNSHFRSRLMVARATPEGRITLQDKDLTLRTRDGHADKRRVEDPDELLEVLAASFGLRFPAGTRFGPPGSPWPS